MCALGAVFAIHVHTQIAHARLVHGVSFLITHTKIHAKQETPKPEELTTFQYHVCSCKELAAERLFSTHKWTSQA